MSRPWKFTVLGLGLCMLFAALSETWASRPKARANDQPPI
jgi:hypothetical protein